MIVVPGGYLCVSKASAIFDLSYFVRLESRSTSSRKLSYRRRRWKVESIRIRRKVMRSSAHRVQPASADMTVAALGALYMRANSPKDPPGSIVATFVPSPSTPAPKVPEGLTYTSKV